MTHRGRNARPLALLMAGSALVAFIDPASAQSAWNGSSDTTYGNAANWSSNAVPGSATAVFIDSTVNAPVVDAGTTARGIRIFVGEAATGRLTVQAGGSVVLGSAGNAAVLNIGGSQTTGANGGNGRVTVTGAGSTISSAGGLSLGVGIRPNATGLLEILDGAVVTSSDGTIGSFAGSSGTVTVSGAGSRWNVDNSTGGVAIGNPGVATALGTLNVLDGGTVSYPGGAAWTLGTGGTINVSGTGSTLTVPTTVQSHGAINIGAGGSATFSTLFNQAGGTVSVGGANASLAVTASAAADGNITVSAGGQASFATLDLGSGTTNRTLTVTGAGSQLTANAFSANITPGTSLAITVADGGTLLTNQGGIGGDSDPAKATLTVTGAGSLWQIAANANNNPNIGNGANAATLSILNGGRVQSLTGFSFNLLQSSRLNLSGVGSTLELAGSISIGSSNFGQATGDVLIENGASLITHGPNDNGFGFGVMRNMTIRSGGSWIMDGGVNAGLQLETVNLLIDGGTLTTPGIVSIGQRFSGTELTLRGASFTARALSVGTVTGNTVSIGGTRTGTAGAAGTFNVGTLALNNGNALVINHTSSNFTIASMINGGAGSDGAPRIEHIAGDTIFSGPNGGYGGVLAITGGRVRINGSLGGNGMVTQVSGGATLGGSGTLGGTVSVSDGIIAPGNSPGTLALAGALTLGSASRLQFELGAPNLAPGTGSDLITVGGNLTLDGTLDVTDAGGFGAGLYRLISYSGALTDNGLLVGTVPSGFRASDLTVQTSVAQQVNLLVGSPAPTSFPFWDGTDTTGNDIIEGRSGTWTATARNWTTSSGADNGAYNPADLLIFTAPTVAQQQGTAIRLASVPTAIQAAAPSAATGTVTVDDSAGAVILRNGVQFATGGYTVTGDAINLTGGDITFRVGDGTQTGADYVATVASALASTGGLVKTDLGALILQGANSYSGGTEVRGGLLQGSATSLQGSIDIGAAGTVLFAQGADGTFRSDFSGTGRLGKQGAGKLTLQGDSTAFGGNTVLTGGELAVDGTLGSSLHVLDAGNGAVLSGGGTIGGSVSVDDATVSPGGVPVSIRAASVDPDAIVTNAVSAASPVGVLTIGGNFALTGASTLAYQLGDPSGTAGVTSDLINVGGNLTLDGTLDVTDAGGFGAGLYRLINYGGSLTDNGLAIGTVPAGFTPADLTVQTSVANQVNLLVGAPITSFTFWDGANTASNNLADGGTGTWRADRSNWTIASGARNGVVDPSQLLVFAGSGGTVTVDNGGGTVRATAGLQFAANGYTVDGGAIALDGTTATLRVGDGTAAGSAYVATIASALTGTARLDKTDLGTLVLSGANTHAGGTRVLGGALQVSGDGALGAAAGTVTLDGGTLRTSAALTSTRAFTVGSSGGTIDSGANALTLSGTLAGSGNLALTGSGSRTISGTGTAFTGTTTLAGGSLALAGSLGGRLVVAAPSVLTGTGRTGQLDLAGTLSAGTSAAAIGTFNVGGDATFRAGSTLRVDVAANGTADRIEVGGRAIVEGGTVAVTALDPELSYADGTVYRIVNAAGGLTGTFAGVSESSAFLDFTLGYDPTGAFLRTQVIAQFPAVARTFNQTQAAGALMNLDVAAGSDGRTAYNAILLLAADPARAAFDATSGEIYPTLLANRQRAGLALAERIGARGRASGQEGLALWGGVLGDRGNIDSDGNGGGSRHDSFGWETGLDYRSAGNGWAAGFSGGRQQGDLQLAARASQARTKAWHVGGYLRYGTGGTGLSAVASAVLANTDASVTRRIVFGTLAREAVAQTDLRTAAFSGELRYGIGAGTLAVGPLASIDHASTRLKALAENGAGALDLSSAGKREGWTRYGVGGFARLGTASGFGDVSVRYLRRDRGDTGLDLAMAGSPTGFEVRAAGGSRNAVRVDARAEAAIGPRWSVSGNLAATSAGRESAVDGTLRLSYRF